MVRRTFAVREKEPKRSTLKFNIPRANTTMKTPNDFLNDLTGQLTDLLNQGKQSGNDVRENVRALVQSQLSKLDVVSREEFDIQQAALEKNRRQLSQLEVQLKLLEQEVDRVRSEEPDRGNF